LKSKIYLVNSEFVQVNFKLKNGFIERYKEKEGNMFYTGYAIMKEKSKIPNAFIHCK
jgi:hypothetical protein